ncbi:PAS domain-containing sensor histidine kinase [Natrarchaeobius chitinivorans]|uniref:histidine kinase n=1 Tax=Natrarchaeobius chitinivorans TaxID=1679083 RepID=A0A3N6NB03_NATCH|nr:PAS domain S-box protein [Natrarchaeobius chitinivorans]RQG95782.1 PAS domain S-box protein [Natrarchaeobius chitinivorans]
MTTTEVAEQINLGRRSTYERLERLVDHGRLETKKVGGNGRVWWQPVAEQRQATTEPNTSDDQFQSLIDATEEYAIFMLDPEGHVQTWNSGAEQIKGYAADEIVGKHFSTFYTDDDRAAGNPEANLREAAQHGAVEDEGWRVRADGSTFWATVTISAIRDDAGTLEGYTKVTRDMTDQREYERRLEAQTERLKRQRDELETELDDIFERISDGFYALDDDLRFRYLNEQAMETLGVDESAVSADIRDEVFLTDPFEDALHEALETQEPVLFEDYYEPANGWFYNAIYPSETGLSVYFREITQEVQRERELTRFKRAVEATGHAIYMTDPEGEITYVNPAFEEITGYTAEEAVGETPSILQSGKHTDDYYETLWETVGSGDVWEEEIVDRRQDGALYYAEQTIAPVTDDNGEIDRFVAVQNDITERKERKRQLSTLIDNVPGMVYRCRNEPNWPMEFVSDACRDITGYKAETIESGDVSWGKDVMIQENHERLTEDIQEAVANGESFSVTYQIKTADDEVRWVRSSGRGVFDDEANFVDIEGIIADITEQKERERELERRANQQQIVADLGQFALETDDLDELMDRASCQVADVLENEYCKVLDLDPAAEELLLRQGVGWHDGIVGEATVSSIEADSQAAYTLANDHPIVVENLETETRFSGPELLTSHDVRSGISTIIGPFDEPWGILGTHDTERREYSEEDVSFVQSIANILAEAIERHQYQQRLEQLVDDLEASNERLEQFAYAASHDLQEPLRMVSSYLQLLERRYGDGFDEDAEEFVAFAVDGADRMREMIDGLLQYSRIETAGDPLEPTDLDTILDEVITDLQLRIEESDADITSESLPRVEGDASQLRQVFQNLLDNAIEYSGDEPPCVHISAEKASGEWIISVHDEGVGIDPGDADRVFEVFNRLHTREEYDGTGIGLALCERIVERHGGEIWVESDPGEGATFSFTLADA